MWELFKDIHWLTNVLDIWWFIGESAIYLSIYNKEVYTYELSLTNYQYLEKNCKGIKNIHYFNWCISNSNEEYIEFQDTWIVSSTNQKQQTVWNSIKTKNYNIIKLLNDNDFDWLKLDIEWWEYDIIKPIIEAWLFNFKKWIIEFHYLSKKENLKYLKYFLNYLRDNKYNYKIISNENKIIKNINNVEYCNIVFIK